MEGFGDTGRRARRRRGVRGRVGSSLGGERGGVVVTFVSGPGNDFPEEPIVRMEGWSRWTFEVVPGCPPGPTRTRFASATMVRYTSASRPLLIIAPRMHDQAAGQANAASTDFESVTDPNKV